MLPTVLVYIELYVEIEAAYTWFSKSKNCSSLIVMKKLAQS